MKAIGIGLLLVSLWGSDLSAQTPYYQGKSLRIVVGYPAGSAHDLWARLIAPQLTKHIPGNPSTVVQVMLGSGEFGSAPMFAPPGTSPELVKILRAAYTKALTSPELIAEAKKMGLEPELITGEEMEALAKEVLHQPAEVISAMKDVMGG